VVFDSLRRGRELQASTRIIMLAQSAVQRYQTVTDQTVCQLAAVGRCCGSHGVAGHAIGQWHRLAAIGLTAESVVAAPIVIQNVAVPEVGDACAAQPTEFCEGLCVGRAAHNGVYPAPCPFQRSAVVRCAQKHDVVEMPHKAPPVIRP